MTISPPMPRRVVVLGGTGFVGRALCERLTRAGDGGASVTVRVPTRRAMHANTVRLLPGVEVQVADVHDDKALVRLLAGCDAVVNLVAILHGNAREFESVHVALAQRLARFCRQLGLSRIVHVSALGAGTKGATEPSRYLQSKAAGVAALKAAALELTVLRPSVIFGAEDRFLNLFAQLQAVFPVMPLAGSDAKFQPVWVQDVAEAIVRCLQHRDTIGQTLEIAGPEVVSLADLVRMAGRWSGHERPILALPPALGRLQALLMECLPGVPLMSRDNLDSMRVPNVASGAMPGLASLGIAPAALSAIAPGYLVRADTRGDLDRWRAAAGR